MSDFQIVKWNWWDSNPRANNHSIQDLQAFKFGVDRMNCPHHLILRKQGKRGFFFALAHSLPSCCGNKSFRTRRRKPSRLARCSVPKSLPLSAYLMQRLHKHKQENRSSLRLCLFAISSVCPLLVLYQINCCLIHSVPY